MDNASAAMAVLDVGNRAGEDNAMETDTDLLKRDIGAGFKEVTVQIDELRRETTERIDELRRETTERIEAMRRESAARIDELCRETTGRIDNLNKQSQANSLALDARVDAVRRECLAAISDSRKEALDHFLALQAQINDLRRETTARIDAFSQEISRRMDRSDAQFRWMVGLMVTSLLATAGLFARTAHML